MNFLNEAEKIRWNVRLMKRSCIQLSSLEEYIDPERITQWIFREAKHLVHFQELQNYVLWVNVKCD